MRALLPALAACSFAASPADAQSDATWTYATPDGMTQLPGEDVAVAGPLQFGVRGFDQTVNARAGADFLRIVPRRGALGPMPLLSEPTANRALVWMLEPLGILWHNPIVWEDGTVDAGGRVLYHVLEGGVMNATWSNAPVGTTLAVELSRPPAAVGGAVYQLGTLRVRVVAGTASVADRVVTVTPDGGRAQVIVYADPLYDAAAIDAVGALLAPAAGHVAERAQPVVEKHVRFTSDAIGIDTVLAIGDTPADVAGPVVLADRGELYVGSPDGWRLSALAVKIIKTGPIGMRRMRYTHGAVGGQTFNFYVLSPRGTVTLWSVGRITAPYRLTAIDRVVVADFPSTDNDYSEDLDTDVMHTRTAWAWDDTTLVEASRMHAAVDLAHTGQEGNSVDGGWRHTAAGALGELAVGSAGGFATEVAPTATYRYDAGDAVRAAVGGVVVYHQLRAWDGAWADRATRVAALRVDPTLYFGAIKDLHAGDVLPAGGELAVNQVVRVGDATPPDELHDRYTLDGPLRDGMLDLDRGARPRASWDLAIAGELATVVFP